MEAGHVEEKQGDCRASETARLPFLPAVLLLQGLLPKKEVRLPLALGQTHCSSALDPSMNVVKPACRGNRERPKYNIFVDLMA